MLLRYKSRYFPDNSKIYILYICKTYPGTDEKPSGNHRRHTGRIPYNHRRSPRTAAPRRHGGLVRCGGPGAAAFYGRQARHLLDHERPQRPLLGGLQVVLAVGAPPNENRGLSADGNGGSAPPRPRQPRQGGGPLLAGDQRPDDDGRAGGKMCGNLPDHRGRMRGVPRRHALRLDGLAVEGAAPNAQRCRHRQLSLQYRDGAVAFPEALLDAHAGRKAADDRLGQRGGTENLQRGDHRHGRNAGAAGRDGVHAEGDGGGVDPGQRAEPDPGNAAGKHASAVGRRDSADVRHVPADQPGGLHPFCGRPDAAEAGDPGAGAAQRGECGDRGRPADDDRFGNRGGQGDVRPLRFFVLNVSATSRLIFRRAYILLATYLLS